MLLRLRPHATYVEDTKSASWKQIMLLKFSKNIFLRLGPNFAFATMFPRCAWIIRKWRSTFPNRPQTVTAFQQPLFTYASILFRDLVFIDEDRAVSDHLGGGGGNSE